MSWIRNTANKVPDLTATLVLGIIITREAGAPRPLRRWRRSRSGCSATSPPSAGPPPPCWAPHPPPVKTSISSSVANTGSGMNTPDLISESLETIFWAKIPKIFDVDPGSGMKKIRIRDKHAGSAIMITSL
jgi:hypothetical protein